MVLLVVCNNSMIIGAKQDRQMIMLAGVRVVFFDDAPIIIATGGATRIAWRLATREMSAKPPPKQKF